jgi:hypothetical protein
LQIQSANLADRINVIGFASLFSGTAVAPARSASGRLKRTLQNRHYVTPIDST